MRNVIARVKIALKIVQNFDIISSLQRAAHYNKIFKRTKIYMVVDGWERERERERERREREREKERVRERERERQTEGERKRKRKRDRETERQRERERERLTWYCARIIWGMHSFFFKRRQQKIETFFISVFISCRIVINIAVFFVFFFF